jgi:endonuclease YncB( thermonuclease family)
VLLPDGTNLNHVLVKDGWWWYRKYAPRDMALEGLENEAREARNGLWTEQNPVPPWEWRKRKRMWNRAGPDFLLHSSYAANDVSNPP